MIVTNPYAPKRDANRKLVECFGPFSRIAVHHLKAEGCYQVSDAEVTVEGKPAVLGEFTDRRAAVKFARECADDIHPDEYEDWG